MLKSNLTQALYTVATTIDQQQRVQAEDYVNSIIDNTKYLHETTSIVVEMFNEPKLNTLLTILLKKMIKGYKELTDEEMHSIANLLILAGPKIDVGTLNLYTGLVVEYLYDVIGLADPFVWAIINKISNEFVLKFNSFAKESLFEAMVIEKFTKKALSIKLTRHYLFNEFKDIYEETFRPYRNLIVPNDNAILIGWESIYIRFYKLMNNLTQIFDDYTFMAQIYTSFEHLSSGIFVHRLTINEAFCRLLKTLFKCLETCYLTLSMKSEIFERLTKFLLDIFFNLDNYAILASISEFGLDFFYLRYMVNILDDFLNDEETGISILSENQHNMGLQAYVESKVHLYPSLMDKIITTFIAKEINSILSGENEELEVYFNVKSKQFKDDPMVCALKFLAILFDFYLFNAEAYMEELIKSLLHQLQIDAQNEATFCSNAYNFYKLSFVQENMHRINKLVNLSPIVANFIRYDISNLNFFVMYFLESYFFEHEIDDTLLIQGLEFTVKVMNQENLNLALIATNIVLLIINKGEISSHKEELLDLNAFLTRFLNILQSLSNEKSDYLMHLLDIFLEVVEVLIIDNKILQTVMNFLFTLITLEYSPEYMTIVAKSTEIFTDILIKAPSDSLNPEILVAVGKLISIQVDKFMQSQQVTYLESAANLLLGYIGKFETACDQAITEILNKNTQFLAKFIEITNTFIEVIKQSFYGLIDYYAEDMKYSFILISFILIANVFSKIYFVVNHSNFIFNYTPGSTSFYIDIRTDNYKNVLGHKVQNKSHIELIVPLSKIGEADFIKNHVYCLQQYMQKLYLTLQVDELSSCFDILDFTCMLFPFLNVQIYEFVFGLFNKINDGLNLIDANNRNNLFLGINRIIARIILTYPSFLMTRRQETFTNIINYLKIIVYSGK